jgi:Cu(I)/Ag(I) efflux system membrane fusion protein
VKTIVFHKIRRGLFLVLASAILLVSSSCSRSGREVKPADVDYYTCSMHPSVKKYSPTDKCPICSMDLTPVKKRDASRGASGSFTVPLERQQQIGVTYATVEKRPLKLTIRAVGQVAYNKERHWDYVARVDGYIKELYVFSRGELIEKDKPLLTIYSPDLLATQNEFISLLKSADEARQKSNQAVLESNERLISSAKARLRLWNIGEEQIAEMQKALKPLEYLTLYSPFRGVIQDLGVDQGRRVSMGDHLVDVADLSTVWVWADFYQDEVPLLQKGLQVTMTTSSYPGEKLKGMIALVDPFINESKRTARARIDVDNSEMKLRPDMYVDVELARDMGEGLVVPVNAIMPTGKHNILFVDKGEGKLEPRSVELGRKFGDTYEVKSGLSENERVVSSANFLIDAEAKVQGALGSW